MLRQAAGERAALSLLVAAAYITKFSLLAAVSTPFYADPLFDAAHDAEFVWHEGEQCWWSVPTR